VEKKLRELLRHIYTCRTKKKSDRSTRGKGRGFCQTQWAKFRGGKLSQTQKKKLTRQDTPYVAHPAGGSPQNPTKKAVHRVAHARNKMRHETTEGVGNPRMSFGRQKLHIRLGVRGGKNWGGVRPTDVERWGKKMAHLMPSSPSRGAKKVKKRQRVREVEVEVNQLDSWPEKGDEGEIAQQDENEETILGAILEQRRDS